MFSRIASIFVVSASALFCAHAASAAGYECAEPRDCVVAGAETDDEATIQARKATGTGPAAGIASDRRIKTDLKVVGHLANGVKIYSFKYIWDDRVHVGLVAQDLAERPDTRDAVLTLSNGLLGVDYGRLGLRLATDEQWKMHGISALQAGYERPIARAARDDGPVILYNRRPQN